MAHARLPVELFAEQIMVMPATQKRWWTEKEVRQLIEDSPGPTPRYELVDGELLLTPGPNLDHQRIGGAFFGPISSCCRSSTGKDAWGRSPDPAPAGDGNRFAELRTA
jgi:Uma2 family endonuclease